MIDNPGLEWGFALLALIFWMWASSQIRYAITRGDLWRWCTAIWMTTLAIFFTVCGSVWWFNSLHTDTLATSIYALVLASGTVFVLWVRLDDPLGVLPSAAHDAIDAEQNARGTRQVNTGLKQSEQRTRLNRRDTEQDAREGEQNVREVFQNTQERRLLP